MTKDENYARLQDFARWVIRNSAFIATELDAGDVQEKALKLGLLEPGVYREKDHGPSDVMFDGDEWLVFTDALLSVAK